MARGGWWMAFAGAAVAALVAVSAVAGESWPVISPGADFPTPEWLARGAGGGLSILPLVCWWAWCLPWAATADWVAGDSVKRDISPDFWSPAATFPFMAAALVSWWIPWALAGQLLMMAAWVAPVIAYCVQRDGRVKPPERVLTKEHVMRLAGGILDRFGFDFSAREPPAEVVPAVRLTATGRNADENKQRMEAAAAMPGFAAAEAAMLGAVADRASSVRLDLGADSFEVRHEVDGVWHPLRERKESRGKGEPETWVEKASPSPVEGEALVGAIKVLAGLDPAARGPQRGSFSVTVDGKSRGCRIQTKSARAGNATQAIVSIEPAGVTFKTCADLGMSEPVAGRLAELLTLEKGLIVLSSPPGSGLTTTFDVVVQAADRLVRDFISIEDAADPPREIQNVKPVRFDARTGGTAIAALELGMREYPRAVVTRDLQDQALAGALVGLAEAAQLVVVSLTADGATDAVARLLAIGIAPERLARILLGSCSQRLVRKLCPRCRQQIVTPPEQLAKLGRTAEELPNVWRPSPHGCQLCVGTGYYGRVAIFELAAGTSFRRAIAARVDAKELRQSAVKEGMQPLRDEGQAKVMEGVTSFEEVQRVFAKG
ncbi:MAG: hypothetical protein EBZ59_09785 [Planctomycetia bacterium]|nr:hypothetical protein [Planctomycetia bacterium]